MHSYHNLPEIFHYLWRLKACPKGSFADLVFRLVAFHQSVEGLAEYPPMIALNEIERYRFLDPDFYKILSVLMIGDSLSYNVLQDDMSTQNRNLFLQSQTFLIDQWNRTENEIRQ